MGEVPENGIPYETIVLTDSGRNAAALSATREGGYVKLRSFAGSNTFENLKKMERFSVNYISWEKKALFLNAALKGWGNEEREFTDEMEEEPYPHMKDAEGWMVCIPEKTRIETVDDEIGMTEVLHVEAKILMWNGSAEGCIKVGEDRNIKALVAYTRYLISEGEVRERYAKRIIELADEDDPVGAYILARVKSF
jgi:hypothetical protein